MKARRCFSLVLLALCASSFAAEPGAVTKRVVLPRSDASFPLTQPMYPEGSRKLGHYGIVTLLVLVDVDGKVVDQRVTVSTGFGELDRAALRETKKWKLVPGEVNGVPTRMWGLFSITFSLEGVPPPEFTEPHRAAQQLFKELTEKMEAAAAAADAQGQQSAAQGEESQPL